MNTIEIFSGRSVFGSKATTLLVRTAIEAHKDHYTALEKFVFDTLQTGNVYLQGLRVQGVVGQVLCYMCEKKSRPFNCVMLGPTRYYNATSVYMSTVQRVIVS